MIRRILAVLLFLGFIFGVALAAVSTSGGTVTDALVMVCWVIPLTAATVGFAFLVAWLLDGAGR